MISSLWFSKVFLSHFIQILIWDKDDLVITSASIDLVQDFVDNGGNIAIIKNHNEGIRFD